MDHSQGHNDNVDSNNIGSTDTNQSDDAPLWSYVSKLEKQGEKGGTRKFKCSFCSEIRQGSYSRVRAHLLGIKYAGIVVCKKVPRTEKLAMQRLEEEFEKKKNESGPREVSLPCEVGSALKKRKAADSPNEIGRMFFTGGLASNLARNPHYHRAFQFAAANKIDGYVPPGYNKLQTTLLEKERNHVEKLLDPLKSTWKEGGVTIVSDGWSDPLKKPLINSMATSGNGPVFIKAVNYFGEVKDRVFISGLMEEVINKVWKQNVVQIITDNAANCKAAGDIIESMYSHIYWTPCVVHTLNLALKNICAAKNVETNLETYDDCNWITIVHGDALAIKHFIMNHNMRLAIFSKFSPLKLLLVADTRFASIVVMLKRMKLIRYALKAMVISDEWTTYRDDDVGKAMLVREKILNDDWWENVSSIIDFTAPIYEMIRLCDTDKPCLHLVYEMWDSMIEKVKLEIYKKEKRQLSEFSVFYDVVYDILVARWTKNNTLLHCLAHSLNPRFYSEAWLNKDSTRLGPQKDAEISHERMECFKRLFPNTDDHLKVLNEYTLFSMKSGSFGDLTCISAMFTMEPKHWWANFGAQAPLLQTLAFKLLGQPTSSSCAERNWSTYKSIHSFTKKKQVGSKSCSRFDEKTKMWDVGGDEFDSTEDIGFLEFSDLSLNEPDFENSLLDY
ncbi:hypothetical protein EUTSA_v10029312mg [Eutrema salsugineum]|uniref:BED-type domain-containing protein n=1 Tax=Eutrema salsugineum TaxID=72664 RepID=V4L344_EUTSA|nr:hypothetical protein EUTSA_v10029312mg [Eutrema salsugineum]